MLGTFLDKLSGLFDQRFLIAYWGPTFIGLGLLTGLVGVLLGPPVVFSWWAHLGLPEQTILGVSSLLIITFIAYLFDALTSPLIRLYEGYWPDGWLTQLAITGQRKQLDRYKHVSQQKDPTDKRKVREANHAYAVTYNNFPRNADELLKPTRLGNVLAAAVEYSYQLYQLDAAIWWPRLVTLLPEAFRTQVDTALTPMIALLNLCTVFVLLTLAGVIALLIGAHWWVLAVIFFGGVLARASYLAALSQAVDYGKFIRVAFDLYRHEILKQMHLSVPDNLVEERYLWNSISQWLYHYTMPWEVSSKADAPRLAFPFYYDMHNPPPTPLQSQEMPTEHVDSAASTDTGSTKAKSGG